MKATPSDAVSALQEFYAKGAGENVPDAGADADADAAADNLGSAELGVAFLVNFHIRLTKHPRLTSLLGVVFF